MTRYVKSIFRTAFPSIEKYLQNKMSLELEQNWIYTRITVQTLATISCDKMGFLHGLKNCG